MITMKSKSPVIACLCAIALLPAIVFAFTPIFPPFIQEMHGIVDSQELELDQKMDAISAYFGTVSVTDWRTIIGHLDRLDRNRAINIVLMRFRDPESSRMQKLYLGEYLSSTLVSANTPESAVVLREYRDFIIDSVINGGVEEFNRPNRKDTLTAVGEWMRIISDSRSSIRDQYMDDRIVLVLIRCLSACDHVYDEADVNPPNIMPGEDKRVGDPSGRNRQRERIPLVLADLKAISAIPALTEIVNDHHDSHFKKNAIAALDVLNKLTDQLK